MTVLAGARPSPFSRPAPVALELVGASPAITRVQELVRRAAALEVGVLLTAEAGVDVESVARELHARSRRSAGPFVIVACDAAANPDASRLAEVLFGAVPATDSGGASGDPLEDVSRGSRIAAARGGTLFLQDVTELPAAVQARLARVARDGEARIEGAVTAIDLRLVASALPTIDGEVHAQRFRSDLFRRLSVARIDLPPLRDRQEDVPALAVRLLERALAADGLPPRSFTDAALALVGAVTWPGNVAELAAVVGRMARDRSIDGDIRVEHVLPSLDLQRAPARFVPSGNLREARLRFERDYISAVLQHHRWRIAEAAHTLGIQRPNLYRKARQLGIPVTRIVE
jgi:DNA-binding NtrC family response regulator